MYRARRDSAHSEWALIALILIAAGFGSLLLSSCGTVIPDPVTSSAASFDANEQNSGIIAATPTGYLVTPHFRDRYNQLIAIYGPAFTPRLEADAGLVRAPSEALAKEDPIAGQYIIDRQHLVYFVRMNIWHKMGRPAP